VEVGWEEVLGEVGMEGEKRETSNGFLIARISGKNNDKRGKLNENISLW
jgi:hypothetical protein